MFLGRQNESSQLHEVDAELPIVVGRVAEEPAGAARNGNGGFGRDVCGDQNVRTAGHVANDQLFEAALGGVCLHTSASSAGVLSSLEGSSTTGSSYRTSSNSGSSTSSGKRAAAS